MNIAELSRDNPRLLELEVAYRKLNLFDTSQWEAFSRGIDIQNFRGEPGYLAQMWGGMTEERYRATYSLAQYVDRDLLYDLGGDDGAFGAIGFPVGADWLITRDWLDSFFEIKFLRDTLGLKQSERVHLWDIGAGYGRLAYRFKQAFPNSVIACLDGVPLSTFLCEFYLQYRGLGATFEEVYIVPLNSPVHPHQPYAVSNTIASNIYSFSEMPLSAVNFWLDFCADLNIRYFFLVPHASDLIHPHYVTSEPDGSHLDYYHLFEQHGYKLIRQQAKFPRELAPQMIYSTDYLMWQRG